ncbi:MAG: glycosyltransferase family 4 protein [bacterium]|nr:glycosyltransferase family 4 protein [bacterium]
MKVLMLGWEFPPFISGGLGTACHGLTRALSAQGTEILFVLPRPVTASRGSHVRLLGGPSGAAIDRPSAELSEFANVRFRSVPAGLNPYERPEVPRRDPRELPAETPSTDPAQRSPAKRHGGPGASGAGYGRDLFAEVDRYAALVCRLARHEDFDVIHAHDWMTFPAGVALASVTDKPLVVHVHSTEFDRSGQQVSRRIYDIERRGMRSADQVLAVSALTRELIVGRYGVPFGSVRVVHNGIDLNNRMPADVPPHVSTGCRTVLFLGRITFQKGPEAFLTAAGKVAQVLDDVRFVMAGTGDLLGRCMDQARRMGLGGRVLFTGFLRGAEVDRAFRLADVYVMPSVSEPFGLTALEAIANDVPVIISRQSGVAEVLPDVLKVDHWDLDGLAKMIVGVLERPDRRGELCRQARGNLSGLTWDQPAQHCQAAYRLAVARHRSIARRRSS